MLRRKIVHDQIGSSVESVLDALNEFLLIGVFVRSSNENGIKVAHQVAKMDGRQVSNALFGG